MTLTWKEPKEDGGSKIKGYYLEKRTPYNPRWVRINRTLFKETEVELTDLRQGDEMEIQVVAENAAGSGPPSDHTRTIIVKDTCGKIAIFGPAT